MASPTTKNMQKLSVIFAIVSAGWICFLWFLEDNPNPHPKPTWWYVYNVLSLGGWYGWAGYYIMFDPPRKENPVPKPHKLWHLLHGVPMLLLNYTITKSLNTRDKALLWFSALVVYRYYRTVVTRYFYSQYKIARGHPSKGPSECTVIVPTVGPKDNPVFEEMVAAILWNKPKQLVFSANNSEAEADIKIEVDRIVAAFKKGDTSYQKEHKLATDWNTTGPEWHLESVTNIEYTFIADSNKRRQTYHAVESLVDTAITVMVDDTAIWHPEFLQATLPAFNEPEVGLVGTNKWVKYIRPSWDQETMSFIQFCKKWYWAGLWNTIGALYLIRHSYETRASNTADGGVFAVSGRTLLVLTDIVKSSDFKKQFLDEHVLESMYIWLTRFVNWHVPFAGQTFAYFKTKGLTQRGFGPLLADDDNFITRWVINHGKSIKIQSSPEATLTTVLGNVESFKYLAQCERWSRTTFRQNPIALFGDLTIWWKWPISVWTVYFPWLYNAALFWDSLAIITFCRSALYLESPHGNGRLCYLVMSIWATKLIKTWPWFREHPWDFFLFFFPIPAYPLFGYYHSLLKVYTAVTCWNNEWSGRNVKKAEEVAGGLAGLKEE